MSKPRCTVECARELRRLQDEKAALIAKFIERRPPDETAWLIEIPGSDLVGPMYHQLEYDNDWTPDANKALRFARREDAQQYIDHIGWTVPKPIEHMWCAPCETSQVLAKDNT